MRGYYNMDIGRMPPILKYVVPIETMELNAKQGIVGILKWGIVSLCKKLANPTRERKK